VYAANRVLHRLIHRQREPIRVRPPHRSKEVIIYLKPWTNSHAHHPARARHTPRPFVSRRACSPAVGVQFRLRGDRVVLEEGGRPRGLSGPGGDGGFLCAALDVDHRGPLPNRMEPRKRFHMRLIGCAMWLLPMKGFRGGWMRALPASSLQKLWPIPESSPFWRPRPCRLPPRVATRQIDPVGMS